MEPLPAEPVEISYRALESSPLRPLIRLMAVATIAKGGTNALYWIYFLSHYSFPMRQALQGWEFVAFCTTLLPALLDLALVGGGWLCWNFEARGRPVVIWLTLMTVALAVLTMVIQISHYAPFNSRTFGYLAPTTLNLLTAQVLPITIWMFFKRPEVAAAMASDTLGT